MMPIDNTAEGYGYKCGICGQWTNTWSTHACSGYPYYYPPFYSPVPYPQSIMPDGIEAKLGRIIELLEQLLRKDA